MKPRIKSYGDEATHFHDEVMLKLSSDYTCLAVILIDSVLKKDESYYPQVFLQEFKHIKKEKITDDLEVSSDDSDKENSNKED